MPKKQHKPSLDSRGYCTHISKSEHSCELNARFDATMPSKYYPSAAPYAELTEYLREMIQERVLTRFIVKALLYPEFMRDIDTTEVVLRRRHKTFVRMFRKGSDHSSETESSEESSDERLERQNAVEYSSEADSHVYSNVKYQTGRRGSDPRWDDTIYESFVDHGEDAGEVRYQRLGDSISSFCFVTECDTPERESFMIGSTPMRIHDKKRESRDNVTHLTTARMNLLSIKQKSDQSENSSFEHRLSGAYMACEDLVNIDESTKMKKSLQQRPMEDRHHSMPTQFVGNRFNNSSRTKIYIPSFKSHNNSDVLSQATTPNNSFDEEINPNHSHSSSMQFQTLMMPVPDNIQAELLYNHEPSDRAESPQKVPVISSSCLSLTRELSPFGKHSLNCDKKSSIGEEGTFSMSKQYHAPDHDNYTNKFARAKFSPNRYRESHISSDSDSGMAGSYTLSPDQQATICGSFTSHNNYSHQPHNASSTLLPSSIDNVKTSPFSETLVWYHDHHSGGRSLMDLDEEVLSEHTANESFECENRSKLLISFDNKEKVEPTPNGNQVVYVSGMYAHWWKKEKLPAEMLCGISGYQPSDDNDDDQHDNNERGSGKKINYKKNKKMMIMMMMMNAICYIFLFVFLIFTIRFVY